MDAAQNKLELQFNLTSADYQAFWWRSLNHPKGFRQLFSLWILFFVFILLRGCGDWGAVQDWGSYLVEHFTYSAGFTLVVVGLFLIRWRTYPLFNGAQAPHAFSLGLEGFTIQPEDREDVFHPLNILRFASDTDAHIFLYFGSKHGIPLPRRAFDSEQTADAFFELMETVKRANLPEIAAETLATVITGRRRG